MKWTPGWFGLKSTTSMSLDCVTPSINYSITISFQVDRRISGIFILGATFYENISPIQTVLLVYFKGFKSKKQLFQIELKSRSVLKV